MSHFNGFLNDQFPNTTRKNNNEKKNLILDVVNYSYSLIIN